jgi:beta-mannanase
MKLIQLLILFVLTGHTVRSQLKFVVEDFEGFANGSSDLKQSGVFTFGYATSSVQENQLSAKKTYSGQRALKIERSGKLNYGGWGKGLTLNIELDPKEDHLNFYIYFPLTIPLLKASTTLTVDLREDDNNNNIFNTENDDVWTFTLSIENARKANDWQLLSIPLNEFKDSNPGGDGTFNANYKQGKLFTLMFSFGPGTNFIENQKCYFDFICFSKGKLPTGPDLFSAPSHSANDRCNIGVFSMVDKAANFMDMNTIFENMFDVNTPKKLSVIHLFQPFGKDDGTKTSQYPSIERMNKIISEGFVPMITLENHFIISNKNIQQPNLYSILDGHFDSFFGYWASQIKQVKGTVLLRMLHEFNGDWYPWCVVHNNKDPKLLAKTFCYIRNIFSQNHVTNVKFIWCPNSMSVPQESWNYIMDAYPGDDFVDYVGLDIYNGAGNNIIWTSFRKEGMENYFLLTNLLPDKPLIICETASRERLKTETLPAQSKAEWVEQMSEALKTDMSKIRLVTWFNEKETFKINSSKEARDAYFKYILCDDYFQPLSGKIPLSSAH